MLFTSCRSAGAPFWPAALALGCIALGIFVGAVPLVPRIQQRPSSPLKGYPSGEARLCQRYPHSKQLQCSDESHSRQTGLQACAARYLLTALQVFLHCIQACAASCSRVALMTGPPPALAAAQQAELLTRPSYVHPESSTQAPHCIPQWSRLSALWGQLVSGSSSRFPSGLAASPCPARSRSARRLMGRTGCWAREPTPRSADMVDSELTALCRRWQPLVSKLRWRLLPLWGHRCF